MPSTVMAERLHLRTPERRLDEDEHATDPAVLDAAATDEPGSNQPTLTGDPLLDSAPPAGDLEHRRIVGLARKGLFGRGGAVRIGRYAIERRIGSGGMGEVYLARDEALDRRIAIKRVRATSASERDQERLRREARALARLSHPNVVQVYEVDEHEGRTFLAMEYVDGQSLGEWLAERPRPWRAVLEVFMAAGRGLIAAHEAGIVHRDFKPDNVLLGRDGSVRVADFGLALAGELEPAGVGEPGLAPRVDARLSMVGAVLGTIRYMPLEQLAGGEVDARSDQFSFCVALYEAVWGTAPFSLQSSLARLTELQTAEPTPPRARPGSRPPASLWRAIRRGLRREPAERWPDMSTLVAALDGVTRRRRRLAWMTGALAVAALGAGALVAGAGEEPAEPCASVERELQGAWDDERRSALASHAAALEAGHVTGSEERVVAGLDRWAAGWVEARGQVCEAQAEQRMEPTLAREHNACLARQRQRVGDLVELVLQPGSNADVLAGAVDAVAELPPATACEDALALSGLVPPPAEKVAEVEAVRRDVDKAHELRLLGRVEEGLVLAEQAEAAARGIGYGPLVAEALAERAKAELAAGSLASAMERLEDAIDAAELEHHDALAADLWTEATLRTLTGLGDQRAGAWQLRRAEVANARIGATPRVGARLAFAHGQLAELRNDGGGAEQHYRAALALTEADDTSRPDRPGYLSTLARLAEVRDPKGSEALRLHRAALYEAEQHYGPRHPHTATMAFAMATALQNSDSAQAAELFLRAAQIWEASHVRPHRELARARSLLARIALTAGELDEAEQHVHELAAILAESLPEAHIDHGEPAQLLATIHAVRGEHEESLRQARITLALWEPEYGPSSQVVQRLHSDAAAMLLALGRIDEATDELESLLPHVVGGPEEVSVRLRRSEAALRQGRLDSAHAEILVVERDEGRLGAHELSYAMLRALVDLRRDTLRPAEVARLRRARANTPFTPDQIATWLTQLEMSATERATLSID